MVVLPVPSLLFPPVLTELGQADLITSEEYRHKLSYMSVSGLFPKQLSDINDVVTVQSGKSPKVMAKTAEVLRRHGFEEESSLLAGRQSRPSSICLCYVVQWSLLMTATL